MQSIVVPWVGYCQIGSSEVLIDTRSNLYSSVPAGTFEEALDFYTRDHRPRSSAAATLIERNYIQLGEQDRSTGGRCSHVAAKQTSTIDRGRTDVPFGSTISAVATILIAALRLRAGTLESALVQEPVGARAARIDDQSALAEPVATFRRARLLIPGRDSCLRDSIALRALLARTGVQTTLVLGVALHPFLAHSWLEHDQHVIGDSAERVAKFTPIWASR